MRIVAIILKWLILALVVLVTIVLAWLALAPPDLIRVGTNYSAKIVCSNVFLAGRDPADVMSVDVQAPGHPLLRAVVVDVDADRVRASLLGFFGAGEAVFRGEALGCASAPDGTGLTATSDIPPVREPAEPGAPWPQGTVVEATRNPAIDAILDDPAMTGPGARAVVVVHRGRIVGERYGAGFDAATPLLGWSITKTVTAALIGTLVKEGKLSLDGSGLLPQWNDPARGAISLSALMAMSSGLAWNESYGDVSDVTRMLYLQPDMAGFAASKAHDPEDGNPNGDSLFNYSSGTTVLLSRIWMNAAGAEAHGWPRRALFGPLSMTSAVMETDAAGTFVGSSYMYASARDWARFGQLLLQRGAWDGRSVLPAGYVDWMVDPAPDSMGAWGKPRYGRGQVWLHGPTHGSPPGTDPDAGFDLPDDAFWMLGHDGQSIAVVPSRDLVVVRLGLTPSRLGYKSQPMVAALAKALAD